jgi:hypothetical protein
LVVVLIFHSLLLCLAQYLSSYGALLAALVAAILKRELQQSLTVEGGLDVLFMYSTKEVLSYEQIYQAVGQIIDKINE